MEKVIRDAGGCTDFVAMITYPDTTTQIPSHYSYTYTINGNVINDEFDNINPDEYNASLESNTSSNHSTTTNDSTSTSNSSVNNTTTSDNIAANESTNTAITESSNTSGTVYWVPKGKSYHTTKSCPSLSKSKTILEGTLAESGKQDPCDRCH